MVTTQLERRYRGGWFARGAYSYGRSDSVSDTTNSTARSTWINVYTPGDINNPLVGVSNFDVRHRVVLSGSYQLDLQKNECDVLDVLQRPDRTPVLVQLRHRRQR